MCALVTGVQTCALPIYFTKGTPRDKFIANMFWTRGPASLNLRATRYGKVTMVHPTTPSLDAEIDPKVIFDMDLGMELRKGIKLTAGANDRTSAVEGQSVSHVYISEVAVALQKNESIVYKPTYRHAPKHAHKL